MHPSRAKVQTILGGGSAHLSFIVRDLQHCDDHRRRTYIHRLPGPSYPTLLRLDVYFFCPRFFGLTARVIPLRSGLGVFCFGRFHAQQHLVPSNKADASLQTTL
jgi:hypothetical protein